MGAGGAYPEPKEPLSTREIKKREGKTRGGRDRRGEGKEALLGKAAIPVAGELPAPITGRRTLCWDEVNGPPGLGVGALGKNAEKTRGGSLGLGADLQELEGRGCGIGGGAEGGASQSSTAAHATSPLACVWREGVGGGT